MKKPSTTCISSKFFKINGQWTRKGGSRDVQENILATKEERLHSTRGGAAGSSRSMELKDFDDQMRMTTLDLVTAIARVISILQSSQSSGESSARTTCSSSADQKLDNHISTI